MLTGLHHLLQWWCWTLRSNYKPRHGCRWLECKHNLDLVIPPILPPAVLSWEEIGKWGSNMKEMTQKNEDLDKLKGPSRVWLFQRQAVMHQCMWIHRRRAHSPVHNPYRGLCNCPRADVGHRGQNVASFCCRICSWTFTADLCFRMREWTPAA